MSEAEYVRCQARLQAAGASYPRTCQECGLGPCRAPMVAPATVLLPKELTFVEAAEAMVRGDSLEEYCGFHGDTFPWAKVRRNTLVLGTRYRIREASSGVHDVANLVASNS